MTCKRRACRSTRAESPGDADGVKAGASGGTGLRLRRQSSQAAPHASKASSSPLRGRTGSSTYQELASALIRTGRGWRRSVSTFSNSGSMRPNRTGKMDASSRWATGWRLLTYGYLAPDVERQRESGYLRHAFGSLQAGAIFRACKRLRGTLRATTDKAVSALSAQAAAKHQLGEKPLTDADSGGALRQPAWLASFGAARRCVG
jgi:hypothetical protein